MDEKTNSIPYYMFEKLEENLKLYEKNRELWKKINQEDRSLERFNKKSHMEKIELMLWHGLCKHEAVMKESLERKESILADKKNEQIEFKQKNNSCSHTS